RRSRALDRPAAWPGVLAPGDAGAAPGVVERRDGYTRHGAASRAVRAQARGDARLDPAARAARARVAGWSGVLGDVHGVGDPDRGRSGMRELCAGSRYEGRARAGRRVRRPSGTDSNVRTGWVRSSRGHQVSMDLPIVDPSKKTGVSLTALAAEK